MKNTVKVLLESELKPELSIHEKNRELYQEMTALTESQLQLTGITPEKVIVLKEDGKDGSVFVEFSNNLERLMIDQRVSFDEAMDLVADKYELSIYEMNVVIDESCINKLNMESLLSDGKYSFVRK